jgi:hypothetical protein
VGSPAVAYAPARRGRSPLALAAIAAAALALVGAAIAFALVRDEDPSTATTELRPQTVRETVTQQGTTVVETVVTTAPAEPDPEPTTTATTATTEAPPEEPSASPSELNDEGFRLMQAGDYEAALPLLEQAVAGQTGDLTEAYASYNLAFTRRSLGQCEGVLDLLARSEQLQGRRGEIQRLRRETERAC